MANKKFDYRKYISQNTFTLGEVKAKNFENSKNVVTINKKVILKEEK